MLFLLLVNSVKFLPYRVKLPEYVFTANIDIDRWHLLSLSVLKELSEFLPYFFPYLLLECFEFLACWLVHNAPFWLDAAKRSGCAYLSLSSNPWCQGNLPAVSGHTNCQTSKLVSAPWYTWACPK